MILDDSSPRGRLLTESSTRAFAALRDRASSALARIRVAAGAAFCLIAAALAIAGETEAGLNFWPPLAHAPVCSGVLPSAGGGRGGAPIRKRHLLPLTQPLLFPPFPFKKK